MYTVIPISNACQASTCDTYTQLAMHTIYVQLIEMPILHIVRQLRLHWYNHCCHSCTLYVRQCCIHHSDKVHSHNSLPLFIITHFDFVQIRSFSE